MVGTIVAACTRLTLSASGESEVISQPAPVFCIQVPSAVTTLAVHSIRNTGWRSGTRAAGVASAMLPRNGSRGTPPCADQRMLHVPFALTGRECGAHDQGGEA